MSNEQIESVALDIRGQICPACLILTLRSMNQRGAEIRAGKVELVVLTDDRQATSTIPATAQRMGFRTEHAQTEEGYRIRDFWQPAMSADMEGVEGASNDITRDEAVGYLRAKVDELLTVMGTCTLKPEMFNDRTLISLDPIGLVADSFRQVIENLNATNQYLSALLDAAQEFSIISTNLDGEITVFNRGAERMLGYTAAEVLGKTPALIHRTNEVEQRARELTQALGRPIEGFETFVAPIREGGSDVRNWTYVRKDGSPLRVSLAVSAVRNESGEMKGFLGVARDMSAQLAAEADLIKLNLALDRRVQERTAELEATNLLLVAAKQEADAASRAKSMFLANMSHELRTPLNAILGFSDLMRRSESIPAAEKETLKIIHKAGDHLLTLINEVLDIAKIEAGQIVVQSAAFDFAGMVGDIGELMRVRSMEKGLQLLIEQAPETPRYLVGDEAKLRQIVINLLSNAIKFTERGGVTLRVGLKPGDEHRLLIEVQDTGPGIAEDDQGKLMQPFVQVGAQSHQKGTGLGLAISRQYAELMSGRLTLSSKLKQGSTFRIDLPLLLAQAEDIPERAKPRSEVTGIAPGQPDYRVLVVEDQLENQLLLMRLLESVGFQVRLAENGAEAVEQFVAWQPDFIWMDQRMPVMDGMEATIRIRALPGGKQVKIVADTASTFREQEDEMMKAGMDDIVHKPFRSEQIFDCMERLLGVQFVRGADAREERASVELSEDALAYLPETMLANLREALMTLNQHEIQKTIDAIGVISPELAKGLRQRTDKFEFQEIFTLLGLNRG